MAESLVRTLESKFHRRDPDWSLYSKRREWGEQRPEHSLQPRSRPPRGWGGWRPLCRPARSQATLTPAKSLRITQAFLSYSQTRVDPGPARRRSGRTSGPIRASCVVGRPARRRAPHFHVGDPDALRTSPRGVRRVVDPRPQRQPQPQSREAARGHRCHHPNRGDQRYRTSAHWCFQPGSRPSCWPQNRRTR